MYLKYDKEYTRTFHSPGIEPWIAGFLKSRQFVAALDLGCGLGLLSLILKLYLGNVEYLVGLDISRDVLLKAKRLNLYDDLVVADARTLPLRDKAFDLLVSIEVVHALPEYTLGVIEALSRNSIILALPRLPEGIDLRFLIERGYKCYRYLLRGLVLTELNEFKVLLAVESKFLKIVWLFLNVLKPILKILRFFENGYILIFR